MKTHKINDSEFVYQTNCWYTNHGQVIGVRELEPGRLHVHDVSRGICMEMRLDYKEFSTCLVGTIQHMYLNNDYQISKWDMDFAETVYNNIDKVPFPPMIYLLADKAGNVVAAFSCQDHAEETAKNVGWAEFQILEVASLPFPIDFIPFARRAK